MKRWKEGPMEARVRETLGEHPDLPFYGVDWYFDRDTEERSDPWLVWNPPKTNQRDDTVQGAVDFIEARDLSWTPFKKSGDGDIFTPHEYYGRTEERRSETQSLVEDLTDEISQCTDGSIHAGEVARLRALRKETRSSLQVHAGKLQEHVMAPLRNALIPCLLETYRSLIGFGNWKDSNQQERDKWSRTRRDVCYLWEGGVGRGLSWNLLYEHENWYGRTFEYVPDAIANGAKAALKSYIPERESEPIDYSRDAILNRARPVFFKWMASQQMIGSALYDRTIEDAQEGVEDEDHPKDEEPTRYIQRVDKVMDHLDPSKDVEQICDKACPMVSGNRVRQEIKEHLKKYHNLNGRMTADVFCRLMPEEAKRLGLCGGSGESGTSGEMTSSRTP